jgi:hypothetical protein
MKLIAVGDNVVDCYLDQERFYPGGNAVNVAVNCARNGAERVAYIGVFGDDAAAEHIKTCLTAEKVGWERSRKTYAVSGQPRVKLSPEGDRVFVGGVPNSAQSLFRMRLTAEDLDYISGFDCCPTSIRQCHAAGVEIAGFLTRFFESGDMGEALGYAADRAASTCGFFGGFGYPHGFVDWTGPRPPAKP